MQPDSKKWKDEVRERAVFDFLHFVDRVNGDGHPPIYGTASPVFFAEWNNFKSADYNQLSLDKLEAINAFNAAADMTPVDGASNRNGEFRYERILVFHGEAKSTLSTTELENASNWQDVNGDGVTDAGELKTLAQAGIASLDLSAKAMDIRTPQGARLTASGNVTFQNGAVRRTFGHKACRHASSRAMVHTRAFVQIVGNARG